MLCFRHVAWLSMVAVSLSGPLCAQEPKAGGPLAGTKPLTATGDLAAQMVAGIDKFLLRELEQSVVQREKHWKRDFTSPEAYNKSIEPNRKRLAHILGVRDPRVKFAAPELVASTQQSALVGKGEKYDIFAVRWPAVRDVHGEGLLLVPKGDKVADIIAIPDCEQTPEQLCGLAEGVPPESQFARRLAESGCRVLVPTLINREIKPRAPPGRQGGAKLTNREYLYRPAFELGRHLIGYELQKILAGVDWFTSEASGGRQPPGNSDPKIGVVGYGEGGMLALYAGALDTRIDATVVSGHFGPREKIWDQPLDRNVHGLLEQFGDAELALMYISRHLYLAQTPGPELKLPSEGGAPAQLSPNTGVEAEWQRFLKIPCPPDSTLGINRTDSENALEEFVSTLSEATLSESKSLPSKAAVLVEPSLRQQR